ncbi:MAG: chromosome segregation protein SMC [Acidimicrobiales bacterium]|nr:chromosome segregation protein SMC [Acidimicrobiales bacterium]
MFLKRLTIKGFKSFADSAILEMEPGVTVVVGPNGSGKSNVVDAIAWVLGAQAPSAVRSQKMDDVIFAGTSTRAALGRAEVSLTIDNSSGQLPVELNDVTITRTLFRSGDSEYSMNGAPCRLLDIQELLSDVGVGRQQHVIISQGQIDAVLNARPEDRRSIIEDAAGILKYRRRKEKAQRRLRSTEANLDRLSDLLREVRRQLRPLERQAEAARRHGDLLDELTALRLHQAGRELTGLRTRARDEAESRSTLAAAESTHTAALTRFDAEVVAAEAELAARGGDDLGDRLVRLEALRERGRGIRAVLVERLRGLERDRSVLVSQQVVVGLEAELERSEAEMVRLNAEAEELAPEAERLALAETELAADRAAFEMDWSEGVPALGGHAAEARGELGVLRASVTHAETERERLAARLAALDEASGRLEAEADRLRGELSVGETAEEPLVAEVAVAESRAHEAAVRRNAAWERVVAAEAEVRTASARVEALALALDEARSRAGAEHLAGIDGVLGTLLDLVEVDEGFEAAFEAAAGSALDAVVVSGPNHARQALRALEDGRLSAAVLALGAGTATRVAPSVGTPVRPHVRARVDVENGVVGVDGLLDRLLGHAALVDAPLTEVVDLALGHPETVLVTPSGDRFGPSGWRVGGDGRGATGAALVEAEERLAVAGVEQVDAAADFDRCEQGTMQADDEVARYNRMLDEHDGRFIAATEALQRLQVERRDLVTESEGLRTRVGELDQRLVDDGLRVTELDELLPALEADEEASVEAGRRMNATRASLEERSAVIGASRTGHDVRVAEVMGRRTVVSARVVDLQARLGQLTDERVAAAAQREDLEGREAMTRRLVDSVDVRMAVLDARLETLREHRRQQSERVRAVAARLDGLRRQRTEAESSLRETRERQSRLEIERAETRMRIENVTATIRSEFDREPEAAIEAPCPVLPDGVLAAARIAELERELKLMGPINPLALAEFDLLKERHEFLQEQLDDIRSTRKELRKVIRSVDEEIVSVFASAFAEVSSHFTELFESLFPGGQGRLRLTNPDDLLETGIEVEARPSGKNVKKLSLLSGGERSLTALAFLFAVFRSRPSPFYVMDEVEAALDDVNLHRFLGLVDQFRDDAQLVIVSHQKRTMEAADCLYGVSMAPGGSSKVISERVGAARAAESIGVLANS